VQAGVDLDGDTPPEPTDSDSLAIRAWNALHNGQGGIDWAGLPLVVAWLGVQDLDSLLTRLLVIKTHERPKATGPGAIKE
jgi:hypothetical protein